jgi:predicted Zn-dependent protease
MLAGMLFLASASADELKLPKLGESSNSLFSPEQEYQLGRAWLRMFRSRAPTLDDPLLQDYLEDLVYRLVTHSELQDRRIEVVVVDNPVINAFAVPGGVIGIHTGLLLYAQSEDELATVLAHEIAHLSQRHFSRGVEQQKKSMPLMLAGMLAGAVLLATTGSEAGLAALSATQAAAIDSQLRFSRGNEQEADRIGMQTLVNADMDPHAAPSMFERMLYSSRYTGANRTPEFMRSHPLSESRISDTRNRARQYPIVEREESLPFHLMRARVQVHHAKTPQLATARFRDSLKGEPRLREADRYGLVLALTESGRAEAASTELGKLQRDRPEQLEYIIAQAEVDMSISESQSAIRSLNRELQLYPENHALTMTYARALVLNDEAHIAEAVLLEQSRIKPSDPGLWYLLAEVQGLSGNILGLHQSRAEYFILSGVFDEAERQLKYAMDLAMNDYHTSAKINQRLKDVSEMRQRMEF